MEACTCFLRFFIHGSTKMFLALSTMAAHECLSSPNQGSGEIHNKFKRKSLALPFQSYGADPTLSMK